MAESLKGANLRVACRCVVTATVLLALVAHNSDAQAQRPFVGGVVPVVGPGAVGGVYFDADGLLNELSRLTPDERLARLRAASVEVPEAGRLTEAGPLRKISLRRLEQAVKKIDAHKQPLPADVRYLAGLTRIEYVFFEPRSGDVILAGPAECWKQLPTGDVVGAGSNRPVLHLDDLTVALRYAFALENADGFIGCSIEPTPAGLKKLAAFSRRLRGRTNRAQINQTVARMKDALGPQQIKLYGIDASSRFALTMVAADYRLKRIALGHDRSGVPGVSSFLDMASKRLKRLSRKRQQDRWWFVGHYDSIQHTPDKRAYQFIGQGVKVDTAPTPADGTAPITKKSKTAKSKTASIAKRFAQSFTKHYGKLATRHPVFAELQNLIGLSLAAELIARHARDAVDQSEKHWQPTHFLDAQSCPVQKFHIPTRVPSLANTRQIGGRNWLISISGGVEIDPAAMTAASRLSESRDDKLSTVRDAVQLPNNTDRWWWD